jgi:hypothetical protein
VFQRVVWGTWAFLCRLGVWLYIATRWYKFRSWVYRWMFERRFLKIPIGTVSSVELLPAIVDYGKKWRSDSWLQTFDAISSPQYAQEVFLGRAPVPAHGFDCDEHAIYEVAVVEASALGVARLLTVTWIHPVNHQLGGHNVCLLQVPPAEGHTLPRWQYMDYQLPYPAEDSIHAVAKQVAERQCPGSEVLVWATAKLDLTPELIQWGNP